MSNLKKELLITSKYKSGGGQGGVSLYLTLMIVATLLSVALGISAIFLGQIETIRIMGNSVLAFYAADAGIEKVLMGRSNPSSNCTEVSPCALGNGAEYHIIIQTPGPNCLATNYCITSVGSYKETKRAIEVSY